MKLLPQSFPLLQPLLSQLKKFSFGDFLAALKKGPSVWVYYNSIFCLLQLEGWKS